MRSSNFGKKCLFKIIHRSDFLVLTEHSSSSSSSRNQRFLFLKASIFDCLPTRKFACKIYGVIWNFSSNFLSNQTLPLGNNTGSSIPI